MEEVRYTATRLRKEIYAVLDRVLETGVPVEIERKGRILRLVPDRCLPGKLANLEPHPEYLTCDPMEIVEMDWSEFWEP